MGTARPRGISDLPRGGWFLVFFKVPAVYQVLLYLPQEVTSYTRDSPGPHPAAPPERRPRAEHLKAMEREELQTALSSAGWVIARAAKILGWTPRQVAYKMKKHGLSSPWKK